MISEVWFILLLTTDKRVGENETPGTSSARAVATDGGEGREVQTTRGGDKTPVHTSVPAAAVGDTVAQVMTALKSQGLFPENRRSGVEEALAQVRAAASRPTFSFDSYYLVGLLEQLEEVARLSDHKKHRLYSATLKKVRAFQHDPSVGELVLQLVGSEEDHVVATAEARWLKTKNNRRGGYNNYRGRGGRGRSVSFRNVNNGECYRCGKLGHMQKNCPNK